MKFFRKKNEAKSGWQAYNLSIFWVSAILFIILFILEYAVPGFVTSWFNPAWFLIIALISAMVLIAES